jgi:hypothetical protein
VIQRQHVKAATVVEIHHWISRDVHTMNWQSHRHKCGYNAMLSKKKKKRSGDKQRSLRPSISLWMRFCHVAALVKEVSHVKLSGITRL